MGAGAASISPDVVHVTGRHERIVRMRLMKRVAWLALAVVVTLALPPAAEAQYFGQNKVQYRQYDWRSITSDHFEIYFYTGLDSLARRTLDLRR